MSEDAELARALEALKADYRKDLAVQIDRIDALWAHAADDSATLRELVRALHSIAGAAGIFGCDRAGSIAASAEALLESCSECGRSLDATERAAIEAHICDLRAAASAPRPA